MPCRAFVVLLLLPCASGCMPLHFLIGDDEPHLHEIEVGDSRRRTEREHLGSPLWRAESCDGVELDVYEFRADRPTHIGKALAFIIMDFFTLGILELIYWELPHLPAARKQIAILFGPDGRIRAISEPWSVAPELVEPERRLRAVPPPGFNFRDLALPTASSAPVGAASLDLRSCREARVDGTVLPDHRLAVAAGRHFVECDIVAFGSILMGSMQTKHTFSADVDLRAGHRYRLASTRISASGRMEIIWLEDADTREVLECEKVAW